ncbi:MAG: aspartyl protease family protein, partial [Alphaproteobacteria bacterium]|nr:aspartyl protease family protein [Alphaproteobacteria bacterium]
GGDGLIGLDLLKGKRITVDFLNNAKITLTPSNRGRVHDATFGGPDTIVVHARSRIGELILTDAEIDGHKIAVVIDTGSQDSVGNDALRRLVARRIGESEVRPVTLVSVTGRKVPADYTTIGRVRIGGVALSNLSVAFADAATFHQFGLDRKPAILLGMAALRLFDRISIDFPRREIRFQLGQRAASNIH